MSEPVEIILDASQLEVIEECPYKWYLGQHQNLTVRRTNSALSTGSFFHEALKFFYSAPLKPRSANIGPTVRYASTIALDKSKWPEVAADPSFYIDRLKDYLLKWMYDDDRSEVIAVEKGFSTLLYEDETRRYILEGVIDLITIENITGLTVTDHKTQSRWYSKYPYSHQPMNYLAFTKAHYFQYNYIGLQDKLNDNTFRREIFKPPEGVLEQWKLDVRKTFDEVYRFTREADFPRRRSGCSSQFGLCQFHRRCEIPDNSKWVPVVLTAYKEKEEKWRAWS